MTQEERAEPETMEFDVVIVGAGPAGLSAAIRLRQLAIAKGRELKVCVLEKGSEVGAHIMGGAVLETRALDELIPDWKARGAPVTTPVSRENFVWLTKRLIFPLPIPPQMRNRKKDGTTNYVISLANLCRWLGKQAEGLGVEIFPGFAAADIYMQHGRVAGVITGEFGRGKDGKPKANFQPGMIIKGRYTLMGEGCRGSISQQLMEIFNLRKDKTPQTYGIGIKELWEVMPIKHKPGQVVHTVGWPLKNDTYGGSFIYHMDNNQVAVGLVVGLDYSNPYLDPFEEFQRFKTHPSIEPLFYGGRRIAYGARALNEGGIQAIPKLIFPGGAIIGCSAGFMNVPKIKGTHTAMKSAMLAAEAVFDALKKDEDDDLSAYPRALKLSWVYEELYTVRNIRPGFRFGLFFGMYYAAIETFVLRGKALWTLRSRPDHTTLKPASQCKKIVYPAPDGVLTFDKLSSVYLSNTNHVEDQPCHLTLKDKSVPVKFNLARYDAPEQRYCPAGVYEIHREGKMARLQINAQNCVHCKTCDIKDPTQNIVWKTPEGGGGPNYGGM